MCARMGPAVSAEGKARPYLGACAGADGASTSSKHGAKATRFRAAAGLSVPAGRLSAL
jgi:hypothetical protein